MYEYHARKNQKSNIGSNRNDVWTTLSATKSSSGTSRKCETLLTTIITNEQCPAHFFILFPSHVLSSPFYSLFLLVVTQIRCHIPGPSPLPTTVRASNFYRETVSALSSLVDSRRVVLTHARRSQQVILLFIFFFFLQINSKSSHGRIRTHGQILLINSSIRGLPYH